MNSVLIPCKGSSSGILLCFVGLHCPKDLRCYADLAALLLISRCKRGTSKSIPKDSMDVVRMAPTAPLSTKPRKLSSFLKTDTYSVLGYQNTEAYAILCTRLTAAFKSLLTITAAKSSVKARANNLRAPIAS